MVAETKPTVSKLKPGNQDGGSRLKLESSDNKRKIESSTKSSIGSKPKSASVLIKSEVPILESWGFFDSDLALANWGYCNFFFSFRLNCFFMFRNASDFRIGNSNGFGVIEIWSMWSMCASFSYFPCSNFVFFLWFFFFFFIIWVILIGLFFWLYHLWLWKFCAFLSIPKISVLILKLGLNSKWSKRSLFGR